MKTTTKNSVALAIAMMTLAGPVDAATYIVDPTLFNATTNTGGDDPAGLATGFTHSALFGGDTIQDAFGNNDGGVEPNSVIFSDTGTADSGDSTMGNNGETVDFIQWTTSSVTIAGYRVNVAGDGLVTGANRSTQLIRFLVGGTLVDLFDLNAQSGAFERPFLGGEVTGTTFRFEFTRHKSGPGSGPRIFEIDALVPIPEPGSLGLLSLGLAGLLLRRRR